LHFWLQFRGDWPQQAADAGCPPHEDRAPAGRTRPGDQAHSGLSSAHRPYGCRCVDRSRVSVLTLVGTLAAQYLGYRAGSSARMRSARAAADSLRCLRVMAITHLLLRHADPGLLAYRIRRESSRSGSELSPRNLGPDVVLGASAAGPDSSGFTTATRRYHRRWYSRYSKLFTLLHPGGLINRPVQIIGG